MRNLFLSVVLLFISYYTFSQTLTGTISDSQSGESLFGATVYIINQQTGTRTDYDGNFKINLSKGVNRIEFRYIGYQNKLIELSINSDTSIVVSLESKTQELEGVTVTMTVDKGSTSEIIRMQNKSAVSLDGVTSEQFKKTPDSKATDVFKRVSGASIQENKFVIIRGLNDRYNFGLINGSPLPSTESDKRAFSFDIFPSNILDNLVIYKSGSPDLPGEFAGGVINVSTLDTKVIHNLSLGLNYNTISTFRNFNYNKNSGLEFLGIAGKSRNLPDGIPTIEDWLLTDKNQRADYSKLMNWNWTTNQRLALPGGTLQWTIGKEIKLKKDTKLGLIFATSYQNVESMNNSIRRDFEEQASGVITKMELKDSVFTKNILFTNLLNLSLKINQKNNIKLKSLYSINSEDRINVRNGVREMDNDPRQWEKSTNFWLTQNNILTNQLSGKHDIKKTVFNWNIGYSNVIRDIPNLRRIVYRKYSLYEDDTTQQYAAVIQSNGTIPTAAGNMFWSKSGENIWSLNYDYIIPVNISKLENEIKLGGWHQFRDKEFISRNFGFSQYKPQGSYFNSQLLLLPASEIFSQQNMGLLSDGTGGFKLDEATNVDDSYSANSFLNSGFLMTDSKINNFRFVTGVRVESYSQKFNYVEFGSNLKKTIDTTVIDVLPSLNLIYSLTDKMKIRAAYFKSVSRPEFRELAPFSFYNFVLDNIVSGNPKLERATIDNLDLRWEWFPKSGQMISVSGFYKKFINPIELINRTGTSGSPELYYMNAKSSRNFGAEIEMRTNLKFISSKFENLSIYTNASLIKSEVNLEGFHGSENRPLQGQSPFIINSGLFYTSPKKDFTATISYNLIGQRIYIVGNVQEPSVWENGRNVIDLQISKTIKNCELKLNIKDIISQDLILFQDLDGNRKYTSGDNRWQEINFGQSISLSFKYNF